MPIPTKTQWSTLKSNAGIAKSAWWKPADAAVGPALGKLESAKANWKAKKDFESALGYLGALAKVHESFDKFLDKKNVATAGALAGQITGWQNEVATKHAQLQGKLPALKAAKKEDLEKTIGQFIL